MNRNRRNSEIAEARTMRWIRWLLLNCAAIWIAITFSIYTISTLEDRIYAIEEIHAE